MPLGGFIAGRNGKMPEGEIALAVPINSYNFQKYDTERITLFGLPYPRSKNPFKKFYRRLTQSEDNSAVNSYASLAIADFKPDIIQIFGSENPFGLLRQPENTGYNTYSGLSAGLAGKMVQGIFKMGAIQVCQY